MILDRIGSNVRKAASGISRGLFGVMRPFKSPRVEIPRKVGFVESFRPCKQAEKILLEIEFKKSRSIEFVHSCQNRYL